MAMGDQYIEVYEIIPTHSLCGATICLTLITGIQKPDPKAKLQVVAPFSVYTIRDRPTNQVVYVHVITTRAFTGIRQNE